MNETGENNDHDDTDQTPKWTNLLCPSCAVYYGVQQRLTKEYFGKERTLEMNK
jgi:hypothetical protein